MSNKTGLARDPFTFSLGGLTTIASHVPAPAVANNRIRQARFGAEKRAGDARNAVPCRDEACCRQAS